MPQTKITAIINTYNEQDNIEACITSLKLLTPHILVIDTTSTDRTVEIARSLDIPVITTNRSHFVEPVRQFSIEQVHDGWIFILDADERITKELADEIKQTLTTHHSPPTTHFRIPRKNMYAAKKWLRYGGWYPDYQIRLFEKKSFVTWPSAIHSTPVFKGQEGFLTNPIVHNVHKNLEAMVEKTMLFEEIEAELLYKAGKQVGILTFFRKFFGELFRRLILRRGFMDGTIGIIESIYQAYSKTITYLYLYEKKKNSTL